MRFFSITIDTTVSSYVTATSKFFVQTRQSVEINTDADALLFIAAVYCPGAVSANVTSGMASWVSGRGGMTTEPTEADIHIPAITSLSPSLTYIGHRLPVRVSMTL